jgi:hypothetical protein
LVKVIGSIARPVTVEIELRTVKVCRENNNRNLMPKIRERERE